MKTMKIIKRSGEEKEFDVAKIENAIRKASQAVDYKNALSEGRIKLIAEEVAGVCAARARVLPVDGCRLHRIRRVRRMMNLDEDE